MATLNPTLSENILKFASEKSQRTAWAVFAPTTLVLIMLSYQLLSSDQTRGIIFICFIYLIIYGCLVWMWFDTGYKLGDGYIYYRSGPMKGKIEIASIRKVERKKEIFGGMKPALGSHGIIVHYNKFDDIYLSPENVEVFIRELTARNPGIQLAL